MKRIDKETFMNWFFDIKFLRTGFNTGMMLGIKYECPDLTEDDLRNLMNKTLKNLKKSFPDSGIYENPSRRY